MSERPPGVADVHDSQAPRAGRRATADDARAATRQGSGQAGKAASAPISEGHFRALVDCAVDAILTIDEPGRVITANPACERLFGHAPHAIVGQDVSMLMAEPDRSFLSRYLEGGEARVVGTGRRVVGQRRDGASIPLHLTITEMRVGDELRFVAILRDLSEEVAVQEDLRRERDYRRAVVDSLQCGLLVRDLDGTILEVNPRLCEITGYEAQTLLGERPPYPHWPTEGRDELPALLTDAAGAVGREMVVRRPNGVERDVLVVTAAVLDAEGAVAGYADTVRDITERRQALVDLAASQGRYRAFENAGDTIITMDARGILETANPACEGMFGWSEEELRGESISLLTPESAGPRTDGTLEGRRRDGSTFPLMLTVAEMRLGEERKFIGVMRDLSEREAAESETRHQRDLAEGILASLTEGLVLMDVEARVTEVSPSFCDLTGFRRDELIGAAPPLPYWPEGVGERIRAAIGRMAEDGPAEWEVEFTRADGTRFPALVTASPFLGADGQLPGAVATVRDETERRGARRLLADSEAAFRLMTENATDLIARLSPDGVLCYVSPASWTLLGRSPHDLLGTSLADLLHPDDRHLLEDGLARMVAARRPTTIVARVLHRDGHWLWFETSARPISDPGSGAVSEFQAACRDVTERVSAVEALRASELDVRALAEHRARLARLQEGLRRVATAVARGAEPEEIFALVARETGGVMDARAALIGRFAGQEAQVVGAWAEDERLTAALVERGVTMPLEPESPAVLACVARTGAPARVSDYRAIRGHFAPELAALGVRSGVGAPIRVGGEVWGALLALSTREEELPSDTEERLSAFAELIELAVESSETREELRRRATYDALTGLMNHYAFQDALAREVEAARRDDRPLSLVLADVDHLRQVNELYGHDAADQALAEVAVRLSSLRRPGDVLARLSGDDFAWLMPGTGLEEAVALAGRGRAAVSEHTLARVGARTISAGVAELAQAGDAHRLVRLAEGARGWAKESGRNLVVGYDPEVVRELTAEERAQRARREQGLAALGALARAVDAKDPSTREHSERVAGLAEGLAVLLGWSVRRASDLRDAALMHDVGKIGVPDAILFKRESLSDAEFAAIKGHAPLGGEITSEVLSEEQVSWIRGHHERWDGRGYPDGLGGEQIPDGARIISVADAFDVMCNIRTYKEPVAADAALDECVRCAATQFSPDVVGALRTLVGMS